MISECAPRHVTRTQWGTQRGKKACAEPDYVQATLKGPRSLTHTHTHTRVHAKTAPRVWEQKKHQACRGCDAAITGYACLRGRQWRQGTFIKMQPHTQSVLCPGVLRLLSQQFANKIVKVRVGSCTRGARLFVSGQCTSPESAKRARGLLYNLCAAQLPPGAAIKFLCQHLLQWGDAPESMFARSVPRVNALVANGVYWC
jgi:hypothetical protein